MAAAGRRSATVKLTTAKNRLTRAPRFSRQANTGQQKSRLGGGGFLEIRQIRLAREQAFALQALALELAVAAHSLGALAGPLFAGLLIGAAQLHLPEDAFTLHLLFQRLERLVDVV